MTLINERRYGLTFEYTTPTRWIVKKHLSGLTLEQQYRISRAWTKAAKTLNTKYFGQTAFYVFPYWH